MCVSANRFSAVRFFPCIPQILARNVLNFAVFAISVDSHRPLDIEGAKWACVRAYLCACGAIVCAVILIGFRTLSLAHARLRAAPFLCFQLENNPQSMCWRVKNRII